MYILFRINKYFVIFNSKILDKIDPKFDKIAPLMYQDLKLDKNILYVHSINIYLKVFFLYIETN